MAWVGALSGMQEMEDRRFRGDAQKMGVLSQMMQMQDAQEKRRLAGEDRGRAEQLRGILSSDLPEDQKIEALKRSPEGMGVLQKMVDIQKKEAPTFAPAGSVPYVGGKPQAQIPFAPQRPESTPPDLRMIQYYDSLPEGHPQKAMLGKIIENKGFGREESIRLAASLRAPAQEPAAQLHTDPKTGIVWERTRDGKWAQAVGPDGQPIGGRMGNAGRGPMVPGAAPPSGATSIPPTINAPAATGGSGFFGGMANTVMDAIGADMPRPDIEQATQALKNLRVQTVTLLQDAVPGRPSNYLMKELEQLAVKPGSLFMADKRSKERLGSTRAMLAQEVERMEREVLQNPGLFTNKEVSDTRNSHSQLRQLLTNYDTVIKSFDPAQNIGGASGSWGQPQQPPEGYKPL